MERGRVRDEQDARAGGGLRLGRAVARPGVFADGDAGDGLADAPELVRVGAWGEVTGFVEDLVVRQEGLVVHAAQLAVAEDGGADGDVACADVPGLARMRPPPRSTLFPCPATKARGT